MRIILAGGIVLVLVGLIHILPLGVQLINKKSLSRITGIIVCIAGVYLIFRALTL